jgi:hypothetical protein
MLFMMRGMRHDVGSALAEPRGESADSDRAAEIARLRSEVRQLRANSR